MGREFTFVDFCNPAKYELERDVKYVEDLIKFINIAASTQITGNSFEQHSADVIDCLRYTVSDNFTNANFRAFEAERKENVAQPNSTETFTKVPPHHAAKRTRKDSKSPITTIVSNRFESVP